jgi:hypothetical protein
LNKRSPNGEESIQIGEAYNDAEYPVACKPMAGAQPTIRLPFSEFCELITYKLLRQIEQMERHTIVENSAQSVSCFFWPGAVAGSTSKSQEYDLQEFRQSVPLQKAQSQARSLVPITEHGSESEEERSRRTSMVKGIVAQD